MTNPSNLYLRRRSPSSRGEIASGSQFIALYEHITDPTYEAMLPAYP